MTIKYELMYAKVRTEDDFVALFPHLSNEGLARVYDTCEPRSSTCVSNTHYNGIASDTLSSHVDRIKNPIYLALISL